MFWENLAMYGLWSAWGALWCAWGALWCAWAIGTKTPLRHEGWVSGAAHLAPLAVAAPLVAWPWPPGGVLGGRFVPAADALFWASALMVALGLGFTIWARVALAGNWSACVTIKEGHDLIRRGPYRWVRHPIYTGLLVAFAGSALARGEWRGVVATAIAFAALWRKLRVEERWMGETFGPAYDAYRAEVAALIPFLL